MKDRTLAAVKLHSIINSCRTPAQVKTAKTMLNNFERLYGPNDCLTRYMADVEFKEVTLWQSLVHHKPIV